MANRLPYLQLYVSDYLADTAHLNAMEHGAYMMLLMNCWQTGKPLPEDSLKLSRIARTTPEEWAQISESVLEFFTLTEEGYRHSRIDRDIAMVEGRSEKNRESANKRWQSDRNVSAPKETEEKESAEPEAQCEPYANAMPTHNEGNPTAMLIKNKETRINNNTNTRAESAVASPPQNEIALVRKPIESKKTAEQKAVFDTLWQELVAKGGLKFSPNEHATQAKATWELTEKCLAQFGPDAQDGAKSIIKAFDDKKRDDRSAGGFWRGQARTALTIRGNNVWGQLLESLRTPAEVEIDPEILKLIGGRR